jgi:hypothetical protein
MRSAGTSLVMGAVGLIGLLAVIDVVRPAAGGEPALESSPAFRPDGRTDLRPRRGALGVE